MAKKSTKEEGKRTNGAPESRTALRTVAAPAGAEQLPVLGDVFGFSVDSKSSQFGKMLLRKDGCTMAEVRKAPWNDTGLTWGGVFGRLVAKGQAEKTKDGRMVVTAKSRAGAQQDS